MKIRRVASTVVAGPPAAAIRAPISHTHPATGCPQLHALLKKVSPNTEVTERDVQHVLEVCDKDHDGAIERTEVLQSCATWKSIVERGENKANTSKGCTLL